MTPDIARLRALPLFLADHQHAEECAFWPQTGTEESCDCGLREARASAEAIPALLSTLEAQAAELARVREAVESIACQMDYTDACEYAVDLREAIRPTPEATKG